MVSEWVNDCERPAAWPSLDEGDNDTTRLNETIIQARGV